MASFTTVQSYKYPRSAHWRYQTVWLGSDDHGVWLGVPGGSTGRRGLEAPKVFHHAFVKLLPRTGWWTMEVNAAPHPTEVYVDICTPVVWTDRELVEMVDLDLDVVRRRDGSVELLDEDEFEQHRRELDYPDPMVASARVTAVEIMLAVEQRLPPFDDTARTWLETLEREA